MKNKLTDLNNHLFVALERLNEEGLEPEKLQAETSRAKAVADVGREITAIASLQLDAAKLLAEYGDKVRDALPMLPPATPAPTPAEASPIPRKSVIGTPNRFRPPAA